MAPDTPDSVHQYQLTNGLRVWHEYRPDRSSVAAVLAVQAGPRYETRATNGISHFAEHMLFTGSERWTEEEIHNLITALGGQWNGRTSFEQVVYYTHVPQQSAAVALDWLAEIAYHSTFPPDKVDKEREVLFQERGGRYGRLLNLLDDMGFGYELERDVRRALYPDSSLGYRIVGEDDSLERIDREALLEHYRQHYTPANSLLVVVGDIEPDSLRQAVEATFAAIPPGKAVPAPEPPPLHLDGPQQVTVRGPLPTDQVFVMTGARTVGQDHPDHWTLEVLGELLERSLTEKVRFRQGLVYGIYAYQVSFVDTGYFGVGFRSQSQARAAILEEIERQLDGIRQGLVDPQRLEEAKTALVGRLSLNMEDNLSRALWLAQWAPLVAAGEPLPNAAVALEAVTAEDLTRVVNTYFVPLRTYVGQHLPVVTVSSGLRAAGMVASLATATAAALWLWRRPRQN